MYEYNMTYPSELYHYGVKGMKWGVKRASKYQSKADVARASADEWDEMARRATAKGKLKKAAKYTQAANEDRAYAAKYQDKANRKVEKRYAKAGKMAGRAQYYQDKSNATYKKYDDAAKLFDKKAKQYDKKGGVFKAEAARRTASALRARGESVIAEEKRLAESCLKRSGKLNAKAANFASQSNVKLGKNKINSILKDSKQKGYANAKAYDEAES